VSRHPAIHTRVVSARIHLHFHVGSHHQKFMVLRTGKGTIAFCGGLDIAYMRTPARWGKLAEHDYRWLWHDIHSKLEGLIARDLEREFVLRWNREKDHSVVKARLIHSKFIMADDQFLSIGSANANPRGFQLDAELNVTLDDPEAVAKFRHRLWAHNLGVAQTVVAGWGQSDYFPKWDAVAAANDPKRTNPTKMTGEAIFEFNALKELGERQREIYDVETEIGAL
jgi:phosphatidylserine/phosphatidylglycerophosphate/cardiolipin synthase-like enzyme